MNIYQDRLRTLRERRKEEKNEGHSFRFVFFRTEGSEADLLREVRKVRIRKHWHMPQQLVANVRLWSVEGLGRVADVLRREEDTEGEGREEGARREQAGDGTTRKPLQHSTAQHISVSERAAAWQRSTHVSESELPRCRGSE